MFSLSSRLRLAAVVAVLVTCAYHMYNKKLANNVAQGLAILKICTLMAIAVSGLANLGMNPNTWANLFARPADAPPLTASDLASAMLLVFIVIALSRIMMQPTTIN